MWDIFQLSLLQFTGKEFIGVKYKLPLGLITLARMLACGKGIDHRRRSFFMPESFTLFVSSTGVFKEQEQFVDCTALLCTLHEINFVLLPRLR